MAWERYEVLPGNPQWVNPNMPTLSKAHVVAWYRVSKAIPAVNDDIAGRKADAKAKRFGRGR